MICHRPAARKVTPSSSAHAAKPVYPIETVIPFGEQGSIGWTLIDRDFDQVHRQRGIYEEKEPRRLRFLRESSLWNGIARLLFDWQFGAKALLLLSLLTPRAFSAENFVPEGIQPEDQVFGTLIDSVASQPRTAKSSMDDVLDSARKTDVDRVKLLEWPRGTQGPSPDFLRLIEDKGAPPEPDISKPGADFGDYPNSAYTLPKGRSYVEVAPFSYLGPDLHNSASNSMAYLLRYGITDDVEFRLTGSGLTSVFDPGTTVTGFAPLIIDTKIHMWDDQMDKLIPAASFEAYIQTNLASPTFQSGYQPSVNLNLDFPFTKDTNVEMTIGYTGVQDAVNVVTGTRYIPRLGHRIPTLGKENLNVNQFSFQWALEQQVTEKFQVFLQGYYNGDVFRQSGIGKVVGIGYFYQFSKVATFFNSYNAGLDQSTPNFATQIGFALAF